MTDGLHSRLFAGHRKWLIVVLMAGVATVVFVYLRQKPLLNAVEFKRIQLGMTEAQVCAILGGPPGDYGVNQGGATMMGVADDEYRPQNANQKVWFDDENRIEVWFDDSDQVVHVQPRMFVRERLTLEQRFRRLWDWFSGKGFQLSERKASSPTSRPGAKP